jgi:hypothetical protein
MKWNYVMLAMSLSLLVQNWRYAEGQSVPSRSISVCYDVLDRTQKIVRWERGVPVDSTDYMTFVDSVRLNIPVSEQNRMFELLNRAQKAGGSKVYY